MAETAVNFAIEKLIPLLIEEVKLQRSVHGQVQLIKQDLETIQSFLKDADAKAEREERNNVLKNWVKQAREVAHRIEDVVDEYRLQMAKHRQGRQRRHGLMGFLGKVGELVKSIKPSHEIASEIRDIGKSIAALKDRKEIFQSIFPDSDPNVGTGNPGRGTSSENDHKLRAHFMDEAEVVGLESPMEELTHRLLDHQTKRTVIPVIGTGGLGKTTLVRKVYDDKEVIRCFTCRAWVTVSRSFKVEELLRSMIKQLFKKNESALEGIETMDKHQLIDKVRNCLHRKRYLLVFDDVWLTEFWGKIELALPTNEEGSRIIITTRHHKVSDYCKRSARVEPYHLKPLQQKEALDLFNLKAFQFLGGHCPDELKKLSHDIVNKCGMIPLAITAIGGLLSTKNSVSEWQKVHDNLGLMLSSNPHLNEFHTVLSESYHDLPYHLKLCLLYFGMFPEDYSIGCKRLIRLWIAEGLVEENQEQTLEDVAEEYLTELINRSLVQVSWLDFDGKPRSCRVHDLMHDFILKKCEELNFCQVLKNSGPIFNSTAPARRLSILNSTNKRTAIEDVANPKIRAFFVLSMEELSKSTISTIFSTFLLLKTLDFEDAPLNALPKEVGNLLNLRYLSVRHTKTEIIPRSIGKLHNLLTLDLKNSLVQELPEEINKLIKLRHLLGFSFHEASDFSSGSLQGVKIKEGFGRLKALKKLYTIDATQGAAIIKELRKLKQLRKLGITKLSRQNGRALCNAVETMTHLRSLSIGAENEQEFLDLNMLTHPPQQLQRLYLRGQLEKLPDWISKLKRLVRLHLTWSSLMNDPLIALNELPELLELELHYAYDGDVLHFKMGYLEKLKILKLKDLPGLKTLRIDEGALPHLEKLHIGPCPQLEEVPLDIANLKSLQTLRFYDMPDELRQRMDPQQGDCFEIVKHISSVLFFNKRGREKRYYCNTLHYVDALTNEFGPDNIDVGAFFRASEMDDTRITRNTQNPVERKATTDSWFWVIASLFSILVVILVLLSKFIESLG